MHCTTTSLCCIRSSRSNPRRESCCSRCVAHVQKNNNRSGVNTAMKKDQFQGFGHLWNSRTLSLKVYSCQNCGSLALSAYVRHVVRDYVKTFLKLKQEASGFPSHVVTDAEKQSYVKDYLRRREFSLTLTKYLSTPHADL